MSLTKKDDQYIVNFELWRQVRAILKGKYAIEAELINYLPGPQYRDYSLVTCSSTEEQAYANRCHAANGLRVRAYWSRGRLFNATARTFESLGGMIWAKEPQNEIQERLAYLNDNADGQGSSIREVAQNITDDLLSVGRYGVLVDMPAAPIDSSGKVRALTINETNNGEYSPRWIQYKAEQIIFVRSAGVSKSVDEIRLEEFEDRRKSEFEWETVKYIRRLVIIDGVYRNQRYNDKNELVSDVIPIANGKPLNEIPFQFFGADTNTHHYSKVTLYDLTSVNLGHFVLDCDNRDNLHFHGQGMTNVFSDMTPDDFADANPNGLDSGAKGVNQFNQNDKVELLQLEATGAIPSEMTRDQDRMVSLGAQLVTDSNPNETATGKKIDSNASMSTLKRIARNTTAGIKNLLEYTGLFLGVEDVGFYKINHEFVTDELSPQMLQVHMALVQGGTLPESTLYESSRKAGLTDKSDEEIKEDLNDQNLLGGTSEDMATLQAQIDALKEALNGGVE